MCVERFERIYFCVLSSFVNLARNFPLGDECALFKCSSRGHPGTLQSGMRDCQERQARRCGSDQGRE